MTIGEKYKWWILHVDDSEIEKGLDSGFKSGVIISHAPFLLPPRKSEGNYIGVD